MKPFIYLIILFFFLPEISFAQSKPKRDVSKDRSVIIARQQKEQTRRKAALIAVRKRKQKARTNSNNQKKNTPIVRKATYLTVNQKSVLFTQYLLAYGGRMSFDVNTDGDNWTVDLVPQWCKVVKDKDGFSLEYEKNPLHENREDTIVVRCDYKEVKIELNQLERPWDIKANFINYHLEDLNFSTLYCLKINTDVSVSGAANEECQILVYIWDNKGNPINTNAGYVGCVSPFRDNVCASTSIVPLSDEKYTCNVSCFIPKKVLQLPKKKNKLCCKLLFYCAKAGYFSYSDFNIYLKAKSKRGVVTITDIY